VEERVFNQMEVSSIRGLFLLARPRLSPKQLVAQFQLQVGKAKIPRILLGTSPFIGSGQFSSRAALYYEQFYRHPENIAKIILAAVDLGVTGVQALPFPPIFSALKAVERELRQRLTVVGTVGPDDPLGNIRDFQRFRTVAMLVHGQLTDERDEKKILELLNEIRATNRLAGLTTHEPFSTLKWLERTNLEVDLLMLPFNRIGMFMDASPVKIAEAIRRFGKPVIGKKVLAAGYLAPKDALTYVAQMGCLDIVALGVASEKEVKETFTEAINVFLGRYKANLF
jgi:hypothetical protein